VLKSCKEKYGGPLRVAKKDKVVLRKLFRKGTEVLG
jgi:hypothetical protein